MLSKAMTEGSEPVRGTLGELGKTMPPAPGYEGVSYYDILEYYRRHHVDYLKARLYYELALAKKDEQFGDWERHVQALRQLIEERESMGGTR